MARQRRARRARPRRRSRLHQHAQLGDGIAARRRARAERHPAGRDARGDGRGLLDGAAHAGDEGGARRPARSSSIEVEWTTLGEYLDHLDTARRRTERRLLRRLGDGARARARRGRPAADARTSWRACRRSCARRCGRSARPRRGARLRAGVLRGHRRAHRARSCGRDSAGMYITHLRSEGNALPRGARRAPARSSRACAVSRGEIYHLKAAGRVELAQARARDRAHGGSAALRARRSPPTCTRTRPARPGSTVRCRRGCRRAASRPGATRLQEHEHARARRARDEDARPTTGRTCSGSPARRTSGCSPSRTRSCGR